MILGTHFQGRNRILAYIRRGYLCGSSGGPGRKGAIFTNVWWKNRVKYMGPWRGQNTLKEVVWKEVILVFAFEVFQKGVEHRLGTIFQEPPTAYESR